MAAACTAMRPILVRIEAYVFAGEQLHGEDTRVPVLAKGRPITAAVGPMCVIGHLQGRRRLPWCSTTRMIVVVSIRKRIQCCAAKCFKGDLGTERYGVR